MEDLYPAGPSDVPATLTRPSSLYKRQAWLAVGSLALFVALYFALAGWFGWTAWRLISSALAGSEDVIVHVLVGGCSAFLCVFMLKALLFMERGGAPNHVELHPEEQPQLFAFLYRLADEAGAPRPHRVYLSARVNAAVFYDLSVLNLLFPSRKNLEIGLPLVNILTLSEFKAVLAHEFGHFAQRSMAIGSWVYIAQQIASHIISKRDALDKLLRVLSKFDLRVAWIGWLLSLIVWSIRSLLDTVFRLVVLAQRALSRQMEFQADLVAVSLTGSDELVHALHKLQAADEAWDRTLAFANSEYQQGRSVQDLFSIQTQVLERVTQILNDPSYGKVPPRRSDAPEQHRVFVSGFAQPPQMWSTHPANSDREENAKRLYLPAPHDARSAWLLFDEPAALRQRLTSDFFHGAQLEPVALEQSLRNLADRYDMLQYAPDYQGAYLGRSLTRHAEQAVELYQDASPATDLHGALQALYPLSLSQQLNQLRALEEERGMLQALRDKVYKASGGSIVFRGNSVSRRDLPRLIEQVTDEAEALRQEILGHDRCCRATHLAIAEQFGNGWPGYLTGLIEVLHYAEHSLADLRDAQGLLANVTSVVLADGKVSSRELKRLLQTANELHRVMAGIHDDKQLVVLDQALLTRLGIESWAASLEEFTLPQATNDNVNEWMQVIDGWGNSLAAQLSGLCSATLEQLLHSEAELARHLRQHSQPDAAPAPTQVPQRYTTLLPGQERKRQLKLDWWDRFQIADGALATGMRLLVAGLIVGAVLGFGSLTGVDTKVAVYNGLGTAVLVRIGDQMSVVGPYSSAEIKVGFASNTEVSARTLTGELIETFTPSVSNTGLHYVYNVAGASPLVAWTASYGNAAEEEPRFLGAPRWLDARADFFFSDPPESISSKSGGAQRRVLSGMGDGTPEEVLKLAGNEAQAQQIIRAHARWDEPNTANAGLWKTHAQALDAPGKAP
ncbi:M48 family metallopeptidase [Ectopseudomonas alcaliphila]|uniref:M48 family metallopeptidase n=1 Tax=Ectopseudomonas alcaliphila TaxID=101564 RepID=A0A1G7BXU9_9GAMM|nr:M48 family metallopeptidase [Pseudomonas alcaliphila]MDX5993019.1 M48 family metallopeptidase [Pseudomonas alcaliphila]SDE31887.1 Zn-dependent protease with chaperone function [Pseudomonas alcaliphila]